MAEFTPIPFKEIADRALGCLESLVRVWLPHGKREGNEWVATNPLRADSRRGSFKINLKTGKWADFASPDAGNDAISIYAFLNGLEQWEAAIEVADQIGFKLPEGCRRETTRERKTPVVDPETIKEKKKEPSPWHPIIPVPKDAEEVPVAHPNRGLYAMRWEYKDANGQCLGWVYRFNTSDGGKETLPLTWCRNEKTGKCEWRWMQWVEPNRPLYGLDELASKPDAYVLLVSGEKCVEAARSKLVKPAIVTWSGGDNAVDKTDLLPLAGRKIYAWADCDAQRERLTKAEKEAGVLAESKPFLPEHEQSGLKAMLKIREKLLAIDPATEFYFAKIPAPGSVESGWDIADAISEGWDASRLRKFILNIYDYASAATSDSEINKNQKQLNTALDASAKDVDNWRSMLITNSKGVPLESRENVFLHVQHHEDMKGVVAFDEFSMRIIKTRPAPWDKPFEKYKPWDDNDSLELGFWMAHKNDLSIRNMDTINNAIKLAASRNGFDPVLNYLEKQEWDGIERLKYWLNKYAGCEQTPYTALAGELFIKGMVARVYKPGCIMRTMPVFEGVQYRGKSSIARILAGDYFSDSPVDLRGKEGFINIQGIWLQEIAELGSFNNQEAPIIKAYLSSASDRFRSPFDKFAKDYPRRTVFIGTTNEDVYLRDKTGNTRFWPFRTELAGSIDLDGLVLNRDQLFAEAVFKFKQGDRWHPLELEQRELFEPEQKLREYDDPWEERIVDWLNKEYFKSTTVSQVLCDCLKIEIGKQTQANSIQVGKILTRLGWKKARPGATKDASRKRAYFRPEEDQVDVIDEEIDDDTIPF